MGTNIKSKQSISESKGVVKVALSCVKNNVKECDGCGLCEKEPIKETFSCDGCGEVVEEQELSHGLCETCCDGIIDRLNEMVYKNFDEEERKVINDWYEVRIVEF